MSEKSAKRQKKATISEQDGASLVQSRYTLKTVLAVLHEVSQCTDDKKIDWNALVQRTTTGISSAREYQMLWRHLAYRDALLEKLDDDAQPLDFDLANDDDSDLECELEAFPSVNSEASAEAAACVKVLIASAIPSDSNPSGSIVEAPLTINVPNFQSCRDLEQTSCSMEGTNVVVPVYVQKQPAPAATVADGLDKRKRKPWSEAEDLELIAAVQKCGEGNWAHMLRGDFKGDRTASQLSQRWGIIRKKHVNLTAGSNTSGPQLSESQLATSRALFLALDMPRNNLTSNTIGGAGTVAGYRSAGTSSRNNSAMSKPSPTGLSGPAEKPRAPAKKTVPKPTPTPNTSDAMVRATAVAAGARIASPSDAESLLKAAQAKNAVHIMPSSSGSIKSTMPGGVSENLPNVHYIRTGLARTPLSNYAAATPSIPGKSVPPQVRPLPTNGTSSDVPTKQNSDVSSTLPRQLSSSSKEIMTTEVVSVSESWSSAAKVQAQGTGTRVPEKTQEVVQDNKVASSVPSQTGLLASKAAEAKGTNGGHGPLNLTTLKKAEVKGPNGVPNSVTLSTLKKAEVKGPIGVPNLSTLKKAEVKGPIGVLNLSTSKKAEVKGPNGVPNSVTLLTSKKAEVKGPNSVPNSVILSTSKKVEVKGPNAVPNSVILSTSKKVEVKGPNAVLNPVILSTSKKVEVKGPNAVPNPVILSASRKVEVKGTNGIPNTVSLSTSKTVEVKGTNGIPNTVSLSTSKTAEVKGTNGAPKPVSLSTSKPTQVKCTISTPNQVSSSTLKTTENSKQVIVITQPKKAVENGNGNKVSGLQPQACTTKDVKGEQNGQNRIEKMEEDRRSVVANDSKISQNTEKMEVDIPSVVTAVEKTGDKHHV